MRDAENQNAIHLSHYSAQSFEVKISGVIIPVYNEWAHLRNPAPTLDTPNITIPHP